MYRHDGVPPFPATRIYQQKVWHWYDHHTAQKLMVAAGRVFNADLLELDRTGVETNDKGCIVVDDFLETTCKNIYALGDALGRGMFRNAANHAAELAWQNAMLGRNIEMDFRHVPHAVFSILLLQKPLNNPVDRFVISES